MTHTMRAQYFSLDAIAGTLIFSIAVGLLLFNYSMLSSQVLTDKDAMLQNGIRASGVLLSTGDDLSATPLNKVSKVGLSGPLGGVSFQNAREFGSLVGYNDSVTSTLDQGAYDLLRPLMLIDGYYDYMVEIEQLDSPLSTIRAGKAPASPSNVVVVRRQVALYDTSGSEAHIGTLAIYIWN